MLIDICLKIPAKSNQADTTLAFTSNHKFIGKFIHINEPACYAVFFRCRANLYMRA
jgi:hypothetical protein